MIWPHQSDFPFKQQIAAIGCAASALAAALLPDLSWIQRVGSPVAVLFCFLVSYFFCRVVLAIFGVVRPLAVIYGFPVIVFDPEISDAGDRAYIVASAIPGAMGACAAVLATFRRWGEK